MSKDDAINQIEAASLSPALYRTARRILDRVHADNGYLRLEYADMRAIVETDSDETVRGHLSRLSAAGLITVRRNAAIHVYWHGADASQPALWVDSGPIDPRENRADSARNSRKTARISRDGRAEFTQNRADFTRIPRDFHASDNEPVYIDKSTTIVVDDDNNNYALSSSSSSQPAAPAFEVSAPGAPTTAATVQAQPATTGQDWHKVRSVYEQNIGLLTPILLPAVKEAIRDYGAELVVMAIERAVRAEVRRWNYVEGILRNWAAEGFNAGTGAGRSKATVGGSAASRGAGQPGGAVGGGPVGAARRQAEADNEPEGWGDFLRQRGLVPAGA